MRLPWSGCHVPLCSCSYFLRKNPSCLPGLSAASNTVTASVRLRFLMARSANTMMRCHSRVPMSFANASQSSNRCCSAATRPSNVNVFILVGQIVFLEFLHLPPHIVETEITFCGREPFEIARRLVIGQAIVLPNYQREQ